MPIKPNLMSMSGANKIYTFCLHCGEVDSIRIENTTIFKKNRGFPPLSLSLAFKNLSPIVVETSLHNPRRKGAISI